MLAFAVYAAALLCSLVVASDLKATQITTCPAYPSIASSLSKCKTATAFCESLLGRSGTTVTESYKIYTTTVPSTFTQTLVPSTTTIHRSTTIPVLTLYSTATNVECASQPPPPHVVHAGAAVVNNVVAAAESCGVAKYPRSYIKAACSCEIDSTVVIASKTVTATAGATYKKSKLISTSYTTSTSYVATTSATTTRIDSNCQPPPSAACKYGINCTRFDPLLRYQCGSGGQGYACFCGFDSHDSPSCYNGGNFTCAAAPSCSYDYDCDDGYFCLYDGYDFDFNCCAGVCVPADACLGDQPTTTGSTPSATNAGSTKNRMLQLPG